MSESRLGELRRAAARHRALLSGGLAAAAVAAALPVLAPAPPADVAVLAAARDLPAGLRLSADDLRTVRVPTAVAPGGAVVAAAGRVLAGPVRAGEVLTDVRLLGAGLLSGLDAGLVGAPLRLADAATAAVLAAGDRVDVLAAATAATSPSATVVASDVVLLAVPAPGSDLGEGALVVVAVTPAVAARLAAAAVSSRLSAVVRPR